MQLNTSIPLAVQGPNLASLGDRFNQAYSDRQAQDMNAQKMKLSQLQLDEAQSQAQEKKTIEGLTQVNNGLQTPQDKQKFLQDLDTTGLGHRIPEFQQAFMQQAAAQRRDAQAAQDDLNKRGDADVMRMLPLIKAIPDPMERVKALQSHYEAHPELKGYDHGFDLNNMPQGFGDDMVQHLERRDMKPEDRAKLEYMDAGRSAFAAAKPGLDAVIDKATTDPVTGKKIGMNQAGYNQVVKALTAVPPQVQSTDEYKEYAKNVDRLKPNPPPSMIAMMTAPVAPAVLDNAAQRIADRKSTLSEEISKGRWIGPKAMEMHDQLVQKVAALDPNYSEQDTESGAAYAKSPKVKTAIQQLDNAYSTVGRLQEIYSKLNNSQFPTLNKAINAGKVQAGDVSAARAAIGKVLGNDELTQAFARGGTGSDKLREMSEKLADPNASPQQMVAQFDELLQGVKRSREAYETQGAGYIKPMKGAKAEASAAAHPQASDAEKWAQANPGDPRAKLIMQRLGK